jgi:hypothetical protein
MSLKLYDEALVAKIKKWINNSDSITLTSPDETRRLFESKADKSGDKPITLPLIAITRGKTVTV